jgi:hypothetical protein
VNDYIARFYFFIFVVEIQKQNTKVGNDGDRHEVSVLFTLAAGTCLV